MSYNEDLAAVSRYGKLRLASLVVAFSCTFAAMLLDGAHWLTWLHAFGWLGAGTFSLFESRAIKRLGRDNDYAILRAILFFVVGATDIVLALKKG